MIDVRAVVLGAVLAFMLLDPSAVGAQWALNSASAAEWTRWHPADATEEVIRQKVPMVDAGDVAITAMGSVIALGATYLAFSAAVARHDADGAGSSPESLRRRGELMGTVAGLITTPIGAHLANRRQGSLRAGVVRTAGVATGVSLLSATVLQREEQRIATLYFVVPLTIVATATWTEQQTSR